MFTHHEYYEMVRVYIESGENAHAARRLYEAESLSRLRALGLANAKVPRDQTIVKVNQRLQEHGQFVTPNHAKGIGVSLISAVLEDNIVDFFETNPGASLRDAARQYGISTTSAGRIRNTIKEPSPDPSIEFDDTTEFCEIQSDPLNVEDIKVKNETNDVQISSVPTENSTTLDKMRIFKKINDQMTTNDKEPSTKSSIEYGDTIDKSEPLDDLTDIKVNKDSYNVPLSSVPIVYTTRLDEMRIFNQINYHMAPKDIRNHILIESFPRYNNQRPMNKPCSIESFQALELQLDNLNKRKSNAISTEECMSYTQTLIQDAERSTFQVEAVSVRRSRDSVKEARSSNKGYSRNSTLLKMCKPLSVVLERIDSYEERVEPIIKRHKPGEFDNRLQIDTINPCLLVLQDCDARDIEVFGFENGEITENFTCGSSEFLEMAAHCKAGIKVNKLKFCCWQKRENVIDLLDLRMFKVYVKEFMKKPHRCSFRKCTCCCRPIMDDADKAEAFSSGSPIISKEDIEIIDLEKKISGTLHGLQQNSIEYGYKNEWLENLMDETNELDTTVTKALKYTRPKQKSTNCKTYKLCPNSFHTKYLQRFDCKDLDKSEYYEIDKNGNLVTYLKKNYVSNKLTNKESNFMRNETLQILPPQNCCCWYGREKVINKLNCDTSMPNNKLVIFLKSSHKCLPGECSCCCKPTENSSSGSLCSLKPEDKLPTQTVKEPKINSDTNIVNNVTQSSEETSSCIANTDIITLTCSKNFTDISSFIPKAKCCSNNSSALQPPEILPKPSKILLNKINPSSSNFSSTQKEGNIQPQTNTAVRVSEVSSNKSCSNNQLQPNSKDVSSLPASAQNLAVDSIITTLLDRFSDVRLTINDDGTVAAALNTPIDTLSTAQLKVLANILSHAQKQVKTLGLRPGPLLSYNEPQEPLKAEGKSCPPQTKSTSVNQSKSIYNKQTLPLQTQCQNVTNIFPKPEILSNFSRLSQINYESLLESFQAYNEHQQNHPENNVNYNSVNTAKDVYVVSKDADEVIDISDTTETLIPKICNVFSLKGTENNVWSNSANFECENIAKRKPSCSEPPPLSKIRVVDPAKLGVSDINTVHSKIMGERLLQYKVLNENLIDPNRHAESTHPNSAAAATITLLPSSEPIQSNILQSFPKTDEITGNIPFPQTTSTITSGQNKFIFINQLTSLNSVPNGNVLFCSSDSNFQFTPITMNAVAHNIQMMPLMTQAASSPVFQIAHNIQMMPLMTQAASSPVFQIANVDNTTVKAKPKRRVRRKQSIAPSPLPQKRDVQYHPPAVLQLAPKPDPAHPVYRGNMP